MIAIVNVGPHDDPNPLGERNYELRINSDVIATFKHKRGDGLAKCLMLAAAAEERRKWEFAAKIVARQSLPNARALAQPGAQDSPNTTNDL